MGKPLVSVVTAAAAGGVLVLLLLLLSLWSPVNRHSSRKYSDLANLAKEEVGGGRNGWRERRREDFFLPQFLGEQLRVTSPAICNPEGCRTSDP